MHGHMADYRMPLSNFLNDEADRGISLTSEQLQQRQQLFERAIGNVSLISALIVHPFKRKGCVCSTR